MFTLDVPASIVLNVTTTDKKSKVRLYTLKQKSDGKYGLKPLCTWTPKYSNMTLYTGNTKMTHLVAGTYYISVESTDKRKGNADYSISIDNQSRFYTKADNSDDLPKKKMNTTWAGITADLGTVNATGMLVEDGWVGFCDATDVAAFTLDTPARISFDVTSSDKTKFKLLQVKDLNSAKAKTLQTTNLTFNRDTTGQYVGTSKPQKLMAGTYYIYMESTTAKKGGSADYTISVTNDTIFYTEVDNSDDLPEKKNNKTWADITADLGTITAPGVLVENGWVGYCDETDVASFTVEGDASISFDLTASDKAQFFVYQVKDTNTYKKKSLQETSLLLDKTTGQYTATTKLLKLKAGTYYISMKSSNAKSTNKNSPGNAYYSISVNGNSVLPNTNQDFGTASPNDNLAMDYLDFQLEETGSGSLALEGNAENNIMASLEDSSGETALPQLTTFGNAPEYANNLANGDCSLGISNPDEQKYNDGIGMAMLA